MVAGGPVPLRDDDRDRRQTRSEVRFGMRSFRSMPRPDAPCSMASLTSCEGPTSASSASSRTLSEAICPGELDWTRRLHQQFKTMHWNSIRYCIGFPPDFWYDIADEEGFLIQDEFPIWLLNPQTDKNKAPEFPVAEKIIPEYVEWMRERWNHPCVVIWDGQNESFTDETGKAIQAVRHLDLSNRPWENGWAEPQSAADCVESHPYLFSRGWSGQKAVQARARCPRISGVPHLNDRQKKLRGADHHQRVLLALAQSRRLADLPDRQGVREHPGQEFDRRSSGGWSMPGTSPP